MKVEITKKEPAPTELPLGVTPDDLAKWRHLYGDAIFIKINVPESEGEVVGAWLRLPSFDAVKSMQDVLKKEGEMQAMQQLYVDCKLKASDCIDKNFKCKSALFSKMDVLVLGYEAEVVKY